MTDVRKTDAGVGLLARAIDFICTSEFISGDQAEKLRKEFNEKFVTIALASAPVPQCEAEPMAMLGGIHGVTLIRHIKVMLPEAQKQFHTTLYAAPARCDAVTVREANEAFDRMLRKNVIEDCAKIADHYAFVTTETTTAEKDDHAKKRAAIIAAAIRALSEQKQ